MARVSLDQVSKRFGDVDALVDLTLDIVDGEFLVLLGPSGCGKSTALRIIAGLDEPTTGTVTIGETVVNGVEPRKRDVAMVFQSYALYPHKTARANIEFPLKVAGIAKSERRQQAAEAAEALGLTEVLDRKPGAMSGGQRQRVALARAMVRRPAVFLMDEPLSNLDAKLRGETRGELIDLHRRLQTTFVYVTHDQVEAMTMGTRIAILDQGVLQQVGPPQEVYDRPATTFVASFIGSPAMNLVPTAAIGMRQRATAGVRPEDFEIAVEGPMSAMVRLVESLGHERLLRCALESGDEIVVRSDATGAAPNPGSVIRLAVRSERVHLFDPDSGRRL